jgi:dihydrofolate reductase
MQNKQPAKIKYIAYVAMSIDGRIAKDSKSGTDWTSKEDWNFFQKSLAKMDAVIVGHNTYKVAENSLKKRNTIVLTSKSLKSFGSVIFFNPKKQSKLSLKKFIQTKNYKKIGIIGGPKVYNFCIKNKMLDELFVTVEPYIFTNGVPMFFGNKFQKYQLSLQSVKKLNKKGTILLQYRNDN